MAHVTTAAFDAVMASGGLETIRAYFYQPNVRAVVAETEARVVSLKATDTPRLARTLTLRDGTLPWFRRPPTLDRSEEELHLVDAARRGCGHVDVIEWFFSRDNAHHIGATLTLLLPLVACFRDRLTRLYEGDRPSDPVVPDVLFLSHVFCAMLTGEQRQSVLDTVASETNSRSLLDVAIAHGARLNTAASAVAFYGLDALRSDMSFLLGGDLLIAPSCLWETAGADDSFLVRGHDDAGDRLMGELHNIASMSESARFKDALAEGYLDVNARDCAGKTLLMQCAMIADTVGNPSVGMVELLLGFNADITLADGDGYSALDHADSNCHVTKLLLANGADPMLPDTSGFTMFDWIIKNVYKWCNWREVLELCLARGADPYRVSVRPASERADDAMSPLRSLFDRLNERHEGRECIRANARFFERDASDAGQSGNHAVVVLVPNLHTMF